MSDIIDDYEEAESSVSFIVDVLFFMVFWFLVFRLCL